MTLTMLPLLALTLGLLQPQTSQTSFELELPMRRELLKKARTIVRADETTFFIPGGSGMSGDLQLGQGPVARLRARSGARGTAITLTPRETFGKGNQPSLRLSPKPHLQVGGAEQTSAAAAQPLEEKTSATPALGWEPKDSAALKTADPSTPLVRRLVPAIGVFCLLGGGALLLLRRRRGQGNCNANTISIVAARALGSRHKLAVVQVDGERLLLAMSDHDVSLISHLSASDGEAAALTSAAAPAVPRARGRFALPQAAAAPVASQPPLASPMAVPAPQAGQLSAQLDEGFAAPPSPEVSSDVAGLLNLRQPAADAGLQGGASA